MRLPFDSRAVQEFLAATEFYESERVAYGEVFASEVRATVERAADFPKSGTQVGDLDPERDVRVFRTRRFPFSVVTAVVAGRRAVVALAHTSRRPGYWQERLG